MNVAVEARRAAPVLHTDPFTKAFMDDPYPGFAAMREAGPVL